MPTSALPAKKFTHNGATLAWYHLGGTKTGRIFIWSHGWNHSHQNLLPLAERLKHLGEHYLIDLPGFGASDEPPAPWYVQNYAEFVSEWLKTLPKGERVWVCHSFGGRVGLRVSAHAPEQLDKLILIGSHGIKPIRPWHRRLKVWAKIRAFKLAKILIRLGIVDESVKKRFGSPDYRNASPSFRATMIRAAGDTVQHLLAGIQQPALLLYGSIDTETPPVMGARIAAALPNSQFEVLDGFDHNTILTDGAHQVSHFIQTWLEK